MPENSEVQSGEEISSDSKEVIIINSFEHLSSYTKLLPLMML